MKRLYVVSVAFDFPVMAETEQEAKDFTDDAATDIVLSEYAKAKRLAFTQDQPRKPILPGYELEAPVYGVTTNVTFRSAIEEERRLLELEDKQIKMPW